MEESIKDYYIRKEKEEPFTSRERQTLGKKERWFVRDIQYVEGINKTEAIKIFRDYRKKSITVKREYRKNISDSLYSGKSGLKVTGVMSHREAKPIQQPTGEYQKLSDKNKEIPDRVYTRLQYGRYLPMGGTARRYYDVKEDKEISRRDFMRVQKQHDVLGVLRKPEFSSFEERREEKKRRILEGEKEE